MTLRFTPEYRIVCLPFLLNLPRAQRVAIRKEQREKLRAAGFQDEYHFQMTDAGLAAANKRAAEILEKTGVTMEVTHGFGAGF